MFQGNVKKQSCRSFREERIYATPVKLNQRIVKNDLLIFTLFD